MLCHNEQLADPMSPAAKALSALTSRRGNAKKTETHVEDVARAEWDGGLYWDESVGPYLPAFNILAAIREGARLSKLGKEVERSVHLLGSDMVPILYEGPRTLDAMWERGTVHVHRCGVKVGQAKIMRTRPKFSRWSLEFTLSIVDDRISREDLERVMGDAGRYTGIGDFRARFGRFTVEVAS